MDFESPDVEKEFPGLYASESGRKSNESDFSDGGDHEKPSKKDLLIGRRKDKKESKKDRGYAALEGESSPEEDTETKSPSKSKKTKSFKFPSKSKEKREKSRDKEKVMEDVESKKKEDKEKEKKKEKEREKEREREKKEKEKREKLREKDKEKEEKAKFKLESKEKLKDKDKDKIKEKDKDKVKEKDKDKKEKKLSKAPSTVTSGVPFEEIFTLGVALPIFGVPLQTSVERSRCHDDTCLPLLVRDAIDYLQAHGIKSTQIYRVDADKIKVQQLRKLYTDREPTYQYHWDVPVACAILKAFISELPESILTQELSYQFEQATAMAEPQKDTVIATLVAKLPQCNRNLLAWLMLHFRHVLDNEQLNHVNIQVIATVMGPALNMSLNLLTYFVTKTDKLFPDVTLSQYVPPLQSIPSNFPEVASEISLELRKQESLLNQIHAEMHAGFISQAREEQLWEGQRIVTQLKRKLRTVQKNDPNSLSMHQQSIDEKPTEDEPKVTESLPAEPKTTDYQNEPSTSQANIETEFKPKNIETLKIDATEDAFTPETKIRESPKVKTEVFSDEDFDFSTKSPVEESPKLSEVTSPEDEKPKLSEKELKLLRLQLENAEYLQLKSILQAKINSEQFEIVKLRSQVAVKNKQENQNIASKENKENYTPEELELKQRLLKENALLEQKRLNLTNQIFNERVACIQLKIELAMKEIL